MKREKISGVAGWVLLVAALMAPQTAKAAHKPVTWTANVGAETRDQSVQADGFFVNEMWINATDKITWTWIPQNEPHTVSFLSPATARPTPPPPVGPPSGPPIGPPFFFGQTTGPFINNCVAGTNGGSATFDGTAADRCASSGILSDKATFTVTFPNPGNFKFVCLIHTDMTGTIHVLSADAPLPYTQADYSRQGQDEASDILKDGDNQAEEANDGPNNTVIAGTGEIVGTGGGTQYRAVVRFLRGVLDINKGDTVTFTNLDPTEPHTVTFGTEPANFNPMAVTSNFTAAADGSLKATVACSPGPPAHIACDYDYMQTTNASQTYNGAIFLNSGFLQATAPDTTGSPEVPLSNTRVSITFNNPGNFYYHCALHDIDGMYGEIIVHDKK
jgi:plastocyanin